MRKENIHGDLGVDVVLHAERYQNHHKRKTTIDCKESLNTLIMHAQYILHSAYTFLNLYIILYRYVQYSAVAYNSVYITIVIHCSVCYGRMIKSGNIVAQKLQFYAHRVRQI